MIVTITLQSLYYRARVFKLILFKTRWSMLFNVIDLPRDVMLWQLTHRIRDNCGLSFDVEVIGFLPVFTCSPRNESRHSKIGRFHALTWDHTSTVIRSYLCEIWYWVPLNMLEHVRFNWRRAECLWNMMSPFLRYIKCNHYWLCIIYSALKVDACHHTKPVSKL